MATVVIPSLEPFPSQRSIQRGSGRINIIPAARRIGKTQLFHRVRSKPIEQPGLEFPLLMPALRGQPMGLFTHEFKDVEPVWQWIADNLKPLIRKADATKRIIYFEGGGVLEVWSLTNEGKRESGRGREYARIVVDEAQKIDDAVFRYWWNFVMRALIIDRQGDVFVLGNPNGKNTFFHELARRGASGSGIIADDLDPLTEPDADWSQYRLFRFKTADNPLIPLDELRATEQELDALTFMQEYLAMFVDYADSPWCYALKDPNVQRRVFAHGLVADWTSTIILSFDFNKRPMTALLGQVWPRIMAPQTPGVPHDHALPRTAIRIIKEFKTEMHTESSVYDTCRLIREYVYAQTGMKIGKWYDGTLGPDGLPVVRESYPCPFNIFVTGDASGDAADGRSQVPTTYYAIICAELGLNAGRSMRVQSSNPRHAESFVQVNTNLQTNPDFLIDEGACPFLKVDMLTVKADKFRGIDKSQADKSHLLDCLRYLLWTFAR